MKTVYHLVMNNTIGNNVYSRRLDLGLSQQELAQMLGTTQTSVSRYESGERHPRVSVLRLLAETLKMRVSELMGEK